MRLRRTGTERARPPAARRARPARTDLALAALVLALGLVSPTTGSSRPPGPVASLIVVLLAAVSAGAVLRRRHRPVAAATVVLACYAAGVLVAGLLLPVAPWVVLWSLATTGGDARRAGRRTAVAAAVTVVLVGAGEARQAGNGAAALLVVATVALALAAVLRRTEAGRLEAVRRAGAGEERLRLARDLHDLVGHGLSVVAVQSSTARMALEAGDARTAGSALAAVEASSRAAMREMRALLGVLRAEEAGPDGPAAPLPGLADLSALVDRVRAGGVEVTATLPDPVPPVAAGVALCAYRVVQEGLTNAVRHAPGATVDVRLGVDADRLLVAVTTAGGTLGDRTPDGGGSGLDGVRTRVQAVGGHARAGPTADGWLMEADLPLHGKEER